MKLLNQPEGRTVKYFDIVLTGVPDWANHIATDANGCVNAYYEKPHIFRFDKYWSRSEQSLVFSEGYLGRVDLEGMDWKSTLMTIC